MRILRLGRFQDGVFGILYGPPPLIYISVTTAFLNLPSLGGIAGLLLDALAPLLGLALLNRLLREGHLGLQICRGGVGQVVIESAGYNGGAAPLFWVGRVPTPAALSGSRTAAVLFIPSSLIVATLVVSVRAGSGGHATSLLVVARLLVGSRGVGEAVGVVVLPVGLARGRGLLRVAGRSRWPRLTLVLGLPQHLVYDSLDLLTLR